LIAAVKVLNSRNEEISEKTGFSGNYFGFALKQHFIEELILQLAFMIL